MNPTNPLRTIFHKNPLCKHHLLPKPLDAHLRQRQNTILIPLASTNKQPTPIKINILNPQTTKLRNPQTTPILQLSHQQPTTPKILKNSHHLPLRKNLRIILLLVGPSKIRKIAQLLPPHLPQKKHTSIQSLPLRRATHMLLHSQSSQILLQMTLRILIHRNFRQKNIPPTQPTKVSLLRLVSQIANPHQLDRILQKRFPTTTTLIIPDRHRMRLPLIPKIIFTLQILHLFFNRSIFKKPIQSPPPNLSSRLLSFLLLDFINHESPCIHKSWLRLHLNQIRDIPANSNSKRALQRRV